MKLMLAVLIISSLVCAQGLITNNPAVLPQDICYQNSTPSVISFSTGNELDNMQAISEYDRGLFLSYLTIDGDLKMVQIIRRSDGSDTLELIYTISGWTKPDCDLLPFQKR
jgi:hypothetical protein